LKKKEISFSGFIIATTPGRKKIKILGETNKTKILPHLEPSSSFAKPISLTPQIQIYL
jgi:hypothetical protein